jgi:hypothetical protein
VYFKFRVDWPWVCVPKSVLGSFSEQNAESCGVVKGLPSFEANVQTLL